MTRHPTWALARRALIAGFALLAAACMPAVQQAGPRVEPPRIDGGVYVAADGFFLPVRAWQPDGPPKAVVLALHGMNDHSLAFESPAEAWRQLGIATYAYDQRGFGGSWNRGLWPGIDLLVLDLEAMLRLVRERHPDVPLYVLGESMGGGVALAAMAEGRLSDVAGTILVAPAIWGRETLPLSLRVSLWLAAHTVPGLELTGEGLGIKPTDNIEILRAMLQDPRVIKKTRVDTIYGVVNLMDVALRAASDIEPPVLVLYGERDEIIPRDATLEALERMPREHVRVAIYEDGYHMLLRDLQAGIVIRDVAAWIADPAAPLPSGADERDFRLLARED